MYDQTGGRFLTLTGHTYGGPCGITKKQEAIDTLYARWFTEREKPKDNSAATRAPDALEDELLLERMFASKNGASIRALWGGNISAHKSESEADLALVSHLAWWADYDPARVDALFRASKLYRPKWDEQRGEQTYGQKTIDKVLEGKSQGDGYTGTGSSTSATPSDEGLNWGELQPLPPGRPPAPNMPPALVPEALRPWLVDASERMSTRLELFTPPALVSLGSLFGRKIAVRPKRDTSWTEPLNLYGVVISPPSSMKTPALNEANSHLQTIAGDAMREFEQGVAQREAMLELARMELAELKKGGGKKGTKTTPEVLAAAYERLAKLEAENHPRRYVANDSTTEKMAELLVQNPNGFLVLRDELIGLLKSFEKHGRESDRAFYLEAWGGKNPFYVDRIGRGSFRVPAVCLSVMGTT